MFYEITNSNNDDHLTLSFNHECPPPLKKKKNDLRRTVLTWYAMSVKQADIEHVANNSVTYILLYIQLTILILL